MSKETKQRMLAESKNTLRISNMDLICSNCIFAFDDTVRAGNTSTCIQYQNKSNAILMGGECPKKKSKDIQK